MTTHIAEQETPKIVESEETLADVIYLPSMPAVELGIQEVHNELRRIAIAMSIKREMCAIKDGVNDDEVELTLSASESQHLEGLHRKLGELTAVHDSIADSIRVAHEDKIREEEEREQEYFTTVIIT